MISRWGGGGQSRVPVKKEVTKLIILVFEDVILFVTVMKNNKKQNRLHKMLGLVFCGYKPVNYILFTKIMLSSHVRCTDTVTLTCSVTRSMTTAAWRRG